jgi:hypothetical protein
MQGPEGYLALAGVNNADGNVCLAAYTPAAIKKTAAYRPLLVSAFMARIYPVLRLQMRTLRRSPVSPAMVIGRRIRINGPLQRSLSARKATKTMQTHGEYISRLKKRVVRLTSQDGRRNIRRNCMQLCCAACETQSCNNCRTWRQNKLICAMLQGRATYRNSEYEYKLTISPKYARPVSQHCMSKQPASHSEKAQTE